MKLTSEQITIIIGILIIITICKIVIKTVKATAKIIKKIKNKPKHKNKTNKGYKNYKGDIWYTDGTYWNKKTNKLEEPDYKRKK